MNVSLRQEEKEKILNDEPIKYKSLTLYPITVKDYIKFAECKPVWSLRMTTLPVRYISMDFLNAVFALEMDAKNEENPTQTVYAGIFYRVMLLLFMSLRIDIETCNTNDFFGIEIENGKPKIKFLRIRQNENLEEISSFEFSTKLRSLIAAQNGIELPDEEENPELVKDEEELKKYNERGKTKLKVDFEDLKASVAYQSHVREKDLNNWTVREFEARVKAIERNKRYEQFASAEVSGMVKFEKGNPYPSWCFDPIDEMHGKMEASKLFNKLSGAGASQQ